MKKLVMLMSFSSILLLGACSTKENSASKANNDTAQTTKQKETTNQFNKAIVANGMEITVKKLKTVDSANGTTKSSKNLYGFDISGKNISSGTKKGLGAIDFTLKTTDGKTHQIDDRVNNFGNEVSEGETVSGKAYFSINKGEKVQSLQYKPMNKVLISWQLNN
ncbi:DUF4352 domain-containing protein [Lactobacillus curvatus]|nr:DUF4352 domain-containing protein [Latilactobacillus curvatus]MSE24060.1 DUF4352 domain-containing protein [Latilactobacillus curvatus]